MASKRSDVAIMVPRGASNRISWPVVLAAICGLGFYLNSIFWWTEPRDMELFLRPWFDHIVRYGPIGAFAHPFGNYTPPYLYLLAVGSLFHGAIDSMYIIKLLSFAGTAFAVFAISDLVKACGGEPKWSVLLVLMPSVAINAALLAQCDALWAGACVLAVAATIRGLTVRSLIWCGIAFAFKSQSAFIAPFIIGAIIGRRAPPWQWAIPPLVFVAMMTPAWLAGWPAGQLAMIYPNQVGWGDSPGRLANPWIIATMFASATAKGYYWVGYAAAAVAATAVAAIASASVRNRTALAMLALLSSLALPFLLPKMLERYFFLADLLSLAVAISYRTRLTILIAVLVQLASSLSLLSYMYFYVRPYPTLIASFMSAAALVATAIAVRGSGARMVRRENWLPARLDPQLVNGR